MNTVKIYNAGDNFEVDRIVELLKDNDIECYIMESGIGGYLAIQQGFSIYGKDIYVLEEDADKAKELINKFKDDNDCDEQIYYDEDAIKDDVKDEKLENDEYKVPWFRNRVVVARIMLFFIIAVAIFCFLLR